MTPPHQQKRRRHGTWMHPAPTHPRTWAMRWGMRARMGWEGRLALEMRWKQTDASALRTGRPLWRRWRGWPMTTLIPTPDATIMGTDSSQGPELSLCDEPADSPPNTPRSLAPHLPGSPMEHMPLLVPTATSVDTVKVHVTKEELDDL